MVLARVTLGLYFIFLIQQLATNVWTFTVETRAKISQIYARIFVDNSVTDHQNLMNQVLLCSFFKALSNKPKFRSI